MFTIERIWENEVLPNLNYQVNKIECIFFNIYSFIYAFVSSFILLFYRLKVGIFISLGVWTFWGGNIYEYQSPKFILTFHHLKYFFVQFKPPAKMVP